MIEVSGSFRSRHPAARLGFLSMTGVSNPPSNPALDAKKDELELELRRRYAGFDRPRLRQIPVIRAYDVYYRGFEKSYHVLLQLESVALKGKPLPRVAALVEAMFMAELDGLILTAGHDLSALKRPLLLDAASGEETYEGMNGKTVTCTPGDMLIRDAAGVVSSVLHGPDSRTRIMPETTSVLYTSYAPEGVEEGALRAHLESIEGFVRLISSGAETIELAIK
jgi:DNA/RNA-binding domain of Phe-tRNA-synthetase-like protein